MSMIIEKIAERKIYIKPLKIKRINVRMAKKCVFYDKKWNGGIKIDTGKMEQALYVIDLTIAETIKNSGLLSYSELRNKVLKLKEEKMKIYKNDEEVINKVLNEYSSKITK